MLLLMKGHPATGKSRIAAALAQERGWPLIDKDDFKDFTLDLPNGNELAYEMMWAVCRRQLSIGVDVIVDSPLSYPVAYATGLSLARDHATDLLVVETNLGEAEWRRRLEARPAEESAHKIRGWARMKEQLVTYADCWQYPIDPAHHLIVDTSLPVADNLQIIQRRLGV